MQISMCRRRSKKNCFFCLWRYFVCFVCCIVFVVRCLCSLCCLFCFRIVILIFCVDAGYCFMSVCFACVLHPKAHNITANSNFDAKAKIDVSAPLVFCCRCFFVFPCFSCVLRVIYILCVCLSCCLFCFWIVQCVLFLPFWVDAGYCFISVCCVWIRHPQTHNRKANSYFDARAKLDVSTSFVLLLLLLLLFTCFLCALCVLAAFVVFACSSAFASVLLFVLLRSCLLCFVYTILSWCWLLVYFCLFCLCSTPQGTQHKSTLPLRRKGKYRCVDVVCFLWLLLFLFCFYMCLL